MLYFTLKWLHLIGAAVLLGTGAGIAFFMLMAHLTRNAATIAAVARIVVIADFLFTATAVVAQPITGIALRRRLAIPCAKGGLCYRCCFTSLLAHSGCPLSGCRSACATSPPWPKRWAKRCRDPITGCSTLSLALAFPPSQRYSPSSG